jgi:hypothetical protein
MIAKCGNVLESDIGIFAYGSAFLVGPGNALLDIVFAFSGNNTSAAPSTTLEVYYQSQPFAFVLSYCQSGLGTCDYSNSSTSCFEEVPS